MIEGTIEEKGIIIMSEEEDHRGNDLMIEETRDYHIVLMVPIVHVHRQQI